jgi:hypothetical protein
MIFIRTWKLIKKCLLLHLVYGENKFPNLIICEIMKYDFCPYFQSNNY